MTSPPQIILLSGGLDSVVNLVMAREKGEVLLCLTFDYGQRAAVREIEACQRVCAQFSLPHRVIPLPWMQESDSSSLIRGRGEVPRLSREDLSDAERTKETARSVWVANRNGVFINIAAAVAESLGASLIVTGFNREEAETFPDNSKAFLDAVNASLEFSTLNKVQVVSYTLEMDKREIVQTGLTHHAPFEEVWSCYLGGEKMCGACESCQRLKRAVSGTGAEVRLRDRFFNEESF